MLTGKEFIEKYDVIGNTKVTSSAIRLLLLGILSGMFLGFAAAASTLASSFFQNAALAKTVSALIFPFGLIMIILTGSELFTGNCLLFIPLLDKKVKLFALIRNLLIVYIGNLIGSVFLAVLINYSGYMTIGSGQVLSSVLKTASSKCSLSFITALISGFLCNILVCTAVMMSISTNDCVCIVITAYIPVFIFVICGFEHSIANMYYVPSAIIAITNPTNSELLRNINLDTSHLNIASFLLRNLLPVSLGNILGGLFVSSIVFASNKK